MTMQQSTVLEFPAMLHDSASGISRKTRTEGQRCAREYLKHGAFPLPRQMREVPPGEVLVMHSGAEFGSNLPRWRPYLFSGMFMGLMEGTQAREWARTEESFESFCLGTPWGGLYYAVCPPPPRSAPRMAARLTALLRFWDVLQAPRYAYRLPDVKHTLEGLVQYIYRVTLDAWCPGGPESVHEHMAMSVERMARATREDCLEAVLRVIPVMVATHTDLKHREELSDPDFLRERLAALPPEDFEDFSSAYTYAVNGPLCAWDRELGRH